MGKGCRLLAMLALLSLLPGCMGGSSDDMKGQAPYSAAPIREERLQDQGNGACLDLATGKLWQVSRSTRITSLAAANHYVQELRLAGYNDWRLPTLAEFYEIFLLIDSKGSADCPMVFGGHYWSGDVDPKGRVGAWQLDEDCQPDKEYIPKKAGYIRAVRP